MLCFACPALVMLCLSPGNKLPGYPRRCPAGHCCLSSFHRRLVHHTVTRITSFRCISHLLVFQTFSSDKRTYVLVSFPVARLPGRCLEDIFFIIAGDIYVSGNGFLHLLPSGRREPGSFASLQTLSYFDSFRPTV